MKKNFRVIQINGFRGILLAFFAVTCLIAGFIAFPGFLTMGIWNYVADMFLSVPPISLFGGILLWAIILFSLFIFSKKKYIVSFKSPDELTEEEVQNVVRKVREQAAQAGLTRAPQDKKTEEELSHK